MSLMSVGALLIAGFVAFMIGAVRWRIEYEQDLADALPLMHADRGRLRWIHRWMVVAMFVTTSALGGLAWLVSDPGVAVGFVIYLVGAVTWVGSLLFRLSAGEAAAAATVESNVVPDWFPPLARLSAKGHATHMLASYGATLPLGWSLSSGGLIPMWLAVAGTVWAGAMAALFLLPTTRFVAAPPFWAHVFTLAIGIALIA